MELTFISASEVWVMKKKECVEEGCQNCPLNLISVQNFLLLEKIECQFHILWTLVNILVYGIASGN